MQTTQTNWDTLLYNVGSIDILKIIFCYDPKCSRLWGTRLPLAVCRVLLQITQVCVWRLWQCLTVTELMPALDIFM